MLSPKRGDIVKCLCFKLKGDYAHFRPYYTTSSPTTYSLMPPTSIYGLLGAILGLDKNENYYYKVLSNAKTRVGIGPIKSIRKTIMGTNLVNTKNNYWVPTNKNSSGPRTPTRFEYLVDIEYLIFVSMEDEKLLDELSNRVRNHEIAYSISMGLANLLADIEFVIFDKLNENITKDYIQLDTSVSIDKISTSNGIKIISNIKYCKERYVKEFGDNRIPLSYIDVLFSCDGNNISVKCDEIYSLGNFNIAFLN